MGTATILLWCGVFARDIALALLDRSSSSAKRMSWPGIHKLSVPSDARWGHRAHSAGSFRYRPRAPTQRWFRFGMHRVMAAPVASTGEGPFDTADSGLFLCSVQEHLQTNS